MQTKLTDGTEEEIRHVKSAMGVLVPIQVDIEGKKVFI